MTSMRTAGATAAIAIALAGCVGIHLPPAGSPLERAADDIVGERPWAKPMVDTLIRERIASDPNKLIGMAWSSSSRWGVYANRALMGGAPMPVGEIRDELLEHKIAEVNYEQEAALSRAYTEICIKAPINPAAMSNDQLLNHERAEVAIAAKRLNGGVGYRG